MDPCSRSMEGRRGATGSSSRDASNGSLGNAIGVRLLRRDVGEVERRNEDEVLSIDGRGFWSRFDCLFGGGVIVPEPEGSPDLVLRCPTLEEALPDANEFRVAKPFNPSSGTMESKRLVRDSRLSREVPGGSG